MSWRQDDFTQAQYHLGITHDKGYGVEQDYNKAKYYFE
jgi:TPR repeat protein